MRILILAPQWPDPPRQGAAIRNLHIALYLARKHPVTLATFEPDGPVDTSRLGPLCDRVEILPAPRRGAAVRLRTLLTSSLPDMAWRLHSEQMAALVRSLCEEQRFDFVHVEGIEMAPYGLLARVTPYSPRLVYDAHNAEYLLQRRAFTTDLAARARWPKAAYSLVQWLRLRGFERELCLASDSVLAVSELDRRALARLAPAAERRIRVLPNGVDPAYWSRGASYPPVEPAAVPDEVLVFDGTMDFRPNVDAVLWFAAEVWPLVRAKRPGARFRIVGRNPSPAVKALEKVSGIEVVGAVDDPRPWVARATIYVVPMRMGGGVRLKVLQAMAMGCAVVSTPMGVEGTEARDGSEVLLARSAPDFAAAVRSLLDDASYRTALGTAAREMAAERYAWARLLPLLDRVYPVAVA